MDGAVIPLGRGRSRRSSSKCIPAGTDLRKPSRPRLVVANIPCPLQFRALVCVSKQFQLGSYLGRRRARSGGA